MVNLKDSLLIFQTDRSTATPAFFSLKSTARVRLIMPMPRKREIPLAVQCAAFLLRHPNRVPCFSAVSISAEFLTAVELARRLLVQRFGQMSRILSYLRTKKRIRESRAVDVGMRWRPWARSLPCEFEEFRCAMAVPAPTSLHPGFFLFGIPVPESAGSVFK